MNSLGYIYHTFDGDAESWGKLTESAPGISLLQTWAFGEAKQASGAWSAERGIITTGESVVGAAQTLVRTAPLSGGLAWINRGPLALDVTLNPVKSLVALNNYFCKKRGLYLRLAPPFSKLVEAPGFRKTSISGWASARVDLTSSELTLRNSLHSKWRNALVRAERAGLELRAGEDEETFSDFLRGHKMHLEEQGAKGGLDTKFLQVLYDALPRSGKLLCFTAWRKGSYLGGVAIARYGSTGEYLAGHYAPAGRKENIGQYLLWMTLKRLKEDGYDRFDLGGMDEKLTPDGIFRFKSRIGGTPYRLANELESEAGGLVNRLVRWRVKKQRSRSSGET